MQRIEADPAFWLGLTAVVGLAFTAAGALLGLLIAWAKAKTAEYEARDAKGTAQAVQAGQGVQQATLAQHGEAIAALQVISQATGDGRQASVPPVVPVLPTAAPLPAPASTVVPVQAAQAQDSAPAGG